MKTIVDAKPFSDALANACTVPRKSRIPCLNEVYVHAYPDKCILAATDLTTWFITEIPAQGMNFPSFFPKLRCGESQPVLLRRTGHGV